MNYGVHSFLSDVVCMVMTAKEAEWNIRLGQTKYTTNLDNT